VQFTVLGIFAFSCGVILLYRLAVLPPPVLLLGATLPALFWFLPIRQLFSAAFWSIAIGFSLGVFWAGLSAHERLEERLPAGLEGKKFMFPDMSVTSRLLAVLTASVSASV